MSHKEKWFYTALIISFFVHIFVLTVLIQPPAPVPQAEFKELKITLGVRKSDLTGAGRDISKNAYFAPQQVAENTSGVQGNFVHNIAGNAEINQSAELLNDPSEAEKDSQSESKKDEASKDAMAEEGKNSLNKAEKELVKVVEQASTNMVVPKITPKNSATKKPQKKAEKGQGSYLGNSLEEDAEDVVSYEQMLPLWLDKFRVYPEEALNAGVSGRGDIFIKIDRNGKVLLSKVTKSTGSPILDAALMRMVADADPVIPVPNDYHEDQKTFSYKITFEFAM